MKVPGRQSALSSTLTRRSASFLFRFRFEAVERAVRAGEARLCGGIYIVDLIVGPLRRDYVGSLGRLSNHVLRSGALVLTTFGTLLAPRDCFHSTKAWV